MQEADADATRVDAAPVIEPSGQLRLSAVGHCNQDRQDLTSAAHTLPKSSSLHNLALLEEAKSLESTDWTNVATEVGPCSVEAWCM